jgi:hypothetical protein
MRLVSFSQEYHQVFIILLCSSVVLRTEHWEHTADRYGGKNAKRSTNSHEELGNIAFN